MKKIYEPIDRYVIALQCDSTRIQFYKELTESRAKLPLKYLNLISTVKALLYKCFLAKEDIDNTIKKAEIIDVILNDDRIDYIPDQALITIHLYDNIIYVITLDNLDKSYIL